MALLLAVAPPARADTTVKTITGWTQIGTGTIIVNSLSTEGVWLMDSATTPTGSTGAIFLPFGAISPALTANGNWYALQGANAASTRIGVASAGNPATIFANRQIATATPAALPSQAMVNGVVIQALSSNSAAVLVGPCATLSASTGFGLAPGQAAAYGATNLSSICIMGTVTTDAVQYTGN
ncbi:hypothetical protein CCR94_16255 [Rhodoblastus sphagnicola]|uniref:Uncharacterized protein n=1 Tax=Rhodoblastus sphagnicola TaxID=333368 RepID=A0A2S6N2W9_9HYPH|nr:hypothetical protein CCR94_16255 [Rhodoblastus sphagnicola]